jgi:chemotaxis protein MotB
VARKRRHEGHANHERWLVSYADFITLLFAFFVVMYAVSDVNARKMKRFVGSVQFAFSPDGTGQTQQHGPKRGTPPSLVGGHWPDQRRGAEEGTFDPILETQRFLQDSLARNFERDDRDVEVVVEEGALLVSVPARGLFPTGSARLRADRAQFLRDLGEVVAWSGLHPRIDLEIPVTPGRTASASDYDLGQRRLSSIVQALRIDLASEGEGLETKIRLAGGLFAVPDDRWVFEFRMIP